MKPSFFSTCSAFALATALSVVLDARVADACGGCFHASIDRGTSVVTDHRMVLSISTKQSVLWDQIRYTGNPAEFAWVLPVRAGARIELARGEMIDALDLATQVSVKGPDRSCGGGGGGGGSGAGCGFSSPTSLSSTDSVAASADAGSSFQSDGGVTVVSQSVVGPYNAVTLRAAEGGALDRWLDANGFATPDSIVPVIGAYAREGFDFIALKLRPGVGVRSMRPVRVVTPGASGVLPLRMVTAGIGAKVGLALWIVTEGRWDAQNFPNAVVDPAKVAWVGPESRSNYRELAAEALLGENGRVWLTEYSQKGTGSAEGLYLGACARLPPEQIACDSQPSDLPWDGSAPDAGGAQADAGSDDASDDAAASEGGAVDSGKQPPPCYTSRSACESFDDFTVATDGLHSNDVWLTKIRAELTPATCSSTDLVLKPAQAATPVSSFFKTDTFTDPSFDPCPGGSSSPSSKDGGCLCNLTKVKDAVPPVPFVIGGIGVLAILRARRRRRTPPT